MLLCLIASWLKPRLSAGLVLRWLQGQQSLVCMLFSDELGILTCDMPKALTAETTGHGQWSWQKMLTNCLAGNKLLIISITLRLLAANPSFKVRFILLASVSTSGNFAHLIKKRRRKLSGNCVRILSKCLLENYPIVLTMLELSEILQFCQTKISGKAV